MAMPTLQCSKCTNQIQPQTAERNGGLCAVCARKERVLQHRLELQADVFKIRFEDEFQTLRQMTRDVARASFKDLEQLCADEQIYGIAVYAFTTGVPVFCGSTLKGLAERESKVRLDSSFELRSEEAKMECIFTECKWSPYEWEHEAHCWNNFQGIVSYLQQFDQSPMLPANEWHAMVLAAYVACLHDLEKEGLFEAHRRKSSLILFCSDCDSSDDEWYRHASAKLLNPPELFQRFYRECIVYTEAEEAYQTNLLGDERQQRFGRYMGLLEC